MADEFERTEEATEKKIEKAREDGNVLQSKETLVFTTSLAGLLVFYYTFGDIVSVMGDTYVYTMNMVSSSAKDDFNSVKVLDLFIFISMKVGPAISPMLGAVAITAILTSFMLHGWNFTVKPVTPQLKKLLDKLNPVKGIKSLFALDKFVTGGQVTMKFTVSFIVGWIVFTQYVPEVNTVVLMSLSHQIEWFANRLLIILAAMLLIYFFFAAIDLPYRIWKYNKDMKMTKQEIKDERKQQEGSPEIKRKIRQKMLTQAMNTMMKEMPNADVVVTNPTHYAVAIRYNPTQDSSPVVVAKGVDFMAQKIKEVAREHEIPIVENPPLARELYKLVDINESIPEQLYQAIAEVLAYVHKLNNDQEGVR